MTKLHVEHIQACIVQLEKSIESSIEFPFEGGFEELIYGILQILFYAKPLRGEEVQDQLLGDYKNSEESTDDLEKVQRKWHSKLCDTVSKSRDENVLIGLCILCAVSMEQIPTSEVENLLPMYFEAVNQIVTRISRDALENSNKLIELIAQLMRLRQVLPASSLSSMSNFDSTVGKMILKIAKQLSTKSQIKRTFGVSGSLSEIENAKSVLDVFHSIVVASPASIRSSMGQLEEACFRFMLFSADANLQDKAAELASCLSLSLGGAKEKATSALWDVCLYCGTKLLEMYYDTEDGKKTKSFKSEYFMNAVDLLREIPNTSFALANAFRGICRCVTHLLSASNGSVLSAIPMDGITSFFQVALVCDHDHFETPGFAQIYTASLHALSAFVQASSIQFLQCQKSICKLLIDALAIPFWIGNCTLENELMGCCGVIALCLKSSTPKLFVDVSVKRAMTLVSCLSEAHALESQQRMTTLAQTVKGKASKRRRTAMQMLSSMSHAAQQHQPQIHVASISALQYMNRIVTNAGCLIDETTREQFDRIVVHLLEPLFDGFGRSGMSTSAPCIQDSALRYELLQCLLTLILVPVNTKSASVATPLALRLFATALHDPDMMIRSFASMASKAVQALIHPSIPVIGAPRKVIVANQAPITVSIECESEAENNQMDLTVTKNDEGNDEEAVNVIPKRKHSQELEQENAEKRPKASSVSQDNNIPAKTATTRAAPKTAVNKGLPKPLPPKPAPKPVTRRLSVSDSDSDSDIPAIIDSDNDE